MNTEAWQKQGRRMSTWPNTEETHRGEGEYKGYWSMVRKAPGKMDTLSYPPASTMDPALYFFPDSQHTLPQLKPLIIYPQATWDGLMHQ